MITIDKEVLKYLVQQIHENVDSDISDNVQFNTHAYWKEHSDYIPPSHTIIALTAFDGGNVTMFKEE